MRFQALKQILEPLKCVGTPYERGRMQGERCQKQIRLCFNAVFQSEFYFLLKRGRWPESLSRNLTLWRARRSLRPALKQYAPQIWEHMQGLAAGSGYSIDHFLLFNQLELLFGQRQVPFSSASSLMIPARFSASEEPLLIRNFDAPHFLRAFNLLRESSSDQGQDTLELTLMPSVGAHSGMNEAGVVIACNHAYGKYNARYPLPVAVKLQQALQSCESALEVVRFFERGQQSGGAILTVMDARNEMYLIELSSGNVFSKAVKDHLLIATNHYQIQELLPENVPVNAYFSPRHGLKGLGGLRVRESTESRFDRLNDLTGTSILFHPNDLRDYFKDHNRSKCGDDNSLCRHGDYYETICSVLFRPASREIQVAMGSPCEYSYRPFQWF